MTNADTADTWADYFACDCLGCLMDAHNRGELTDDEYEDILAAQQEMDAAKIPCPRCHEQAYVSMYEPDVAHCPHCGLYIIREVTYDNWEPLRDGPTIERDESGQSEATPEDVRGN